MFAKMSRLAVTGLVNASGAVRLRQSNWRLYVKASLMVFETEAQQE